MTVQVLSAIAGVILSLLFSYVPGLNTWYAVQAEGNKKLYMLGLLFVTAAGVFGLSCTKYGAMVGINFPCTEQGAVEMLEVFFYAAIANQTAYKLSPQVLAVKVAKQDPGVVTVVDE